MSVSFAHEFEEPFAADFSLFEYPNERARIQSAVEWYYRYDDSVSKAFL